MEKFDSISDESWKAFGKPTPAKQHKKRYRDVCINDYIAKDEFELLTVLENENCHLHYGPVRQTSAKRMKEAKMFTDCQSSCGIIGLSIKAFCHNRKRIT